MRTAVFAALALICAASIADARPRGLHPRCNIDWPCVGAGQFFAENAKNAGRFDIARKASKIRYKSAVSRQFDIAISAPARYIAGRLKCAVNVNAALAARGIRGTGSALARSFLSWGRASGPVPGAVAVYGRRGGGHVAIVSRVENGRVYVLNPSSRRQRWVEAVYPRPALAYRVAG